MRLTLFDRRRRVRYIQEAVAFGLFLPGLELFHRFTLYEPVCDERQMNSSSTSTPSAPMICCCSTAATRAPGWWRC